MARRSTKARKAARRREVAVATIRAQETRLDAVTERELRAQHRRKASSAPVRQLCGSCGLRRKGVRQLGKSAVCPGCNAKLVAQAAG